MAKNDIILNIGFKIDKSSINTKAITDSISKALRNISIDKIKISKSVIDDAFKGAAPRITKLSVNKSAINKAFGDVTPTLKKLNLSASAVARLRSDLTKAFSNLSFNVNPKLGTQRQGRSGGGAGGGAATPGGQQQQGITPGQVLVAAREQTRLKAYKSLVEEIATRTTPAALRAQQRYNRAVSQGGISFKELGARVSAITQRFGEYAVAIRIVGALQQTVAAGVRGIFDFDEAIQDLAKVGRAAQNIGSAFSVLTSTAINTGRGIGEVSTAINEFVRQGKSLAESAKFAEEALKLANISTLNAADSARLATAAQQVFGVTAAELSDKLGTIAVFADQSATSVTEVGTAFLRSASSAEAAGVGFEQLTGLLAATLEQTRLGAATVGTAFKTLFARTQKFRKEIVDLNNSFAKSVGAQDAVIDSSDSVLDIFNKISKIFPLLNAQQKNQIANQVAGVRQTNVFIGAINNLQKAQELYNQEVDGATALNEKNEKELQKLSVRARNTTTAFKSLAASIAGVSTGDQGGAASFLGTFLDSATSSLQILSKLTTALDGVEKAGINLGDAFKSGLLGALIGIVNVFRGSLLSGARDFFTTTNAGSQQLIKNLVAEQKLYAQRNPQIARATQGTGQLNQGQQAVNANLSTQVQLQGSINNLISAQASQQSQVIQRGATINNQLKARLQNEKRSIQDLLKLNSKISNAPSQDKSATQRGAETAVVFAVSSLVSQGLDEFATDLQKTASKTGDSLDQLSADVVKAGSSLAQNAALLGSIFGKTGVKVAAVTAALEFAAKRIGKALADAESAIQQQFISTTLDNINTVPLVRQLDSSAKGLSVLANGISDVIETERRRVDITEKVNEASNSYLRTLRSQKLQSEGLSSSFADSISTIESGLKEVGRLRSDGFNSEGTGLNLVQASEFNNGGNDLNRAGILTDLLGSDIPFKIDTTAAESLKTEIQRSNEELARLQAQAQEATSPFTNLAREMRGIAESSNLSKEDVTALQQRIENLGGVFDRFDDNSLISNLIDPQFLNLIQDVTQDLITDQQSAVDTAGKLAEESEKRAKALEDGAGFQEKQNAVATRLQELNSQLSNEQKTQRDNLISISSAYKEIQSRLANIGKETEISLANQKKAFNEARREIDIKSELAAIESKRIKSLDEVLATQSTISRLRGDTDTKPANLLQIEFDLLNQRLEKELQLNTVKRQREALNSKEIKNAESLVKAAEAAQDTERLAEASDALAALQANARAQGAALGRRETEANGQAQAQEILNRLPDLFLDEIGRQVEASNKRVADSEKQRSEAIEAVIEANSKIISAEQSLASARANLASANSDIVSALREAADAQAKYAIDVRNAQRAALESTGIQFGLANAFEFASSNIDQVTNKLNGTIASEQLLATIRAESAADLLGKVTQLASTISGFAVSFFTASDQQRNQLLEAQTIAQGVAAGNISAASVPEDLRASVAQFTDIIPGLKEQIEGFGAEQTGLASQLEQLRQVSLQLAKDSVSREQLGATQDALAAAQSAAAQAEEGVRTAKDQLAVALAQKQVALASLSEATANRNIALADANNLKFYTDRALNKLEGIEDGTREGIGVLKSVGRDIVNALRSLSSAGREAIGNAAGGTLSGSEINGVIGAARREKRLMPAGSKLMLANTSETVLTRRQAARIGLRPKRQANAVSGNADATALTSLMESLVGEIRGLRSDVSTGGVQSVQLNVDTQRNINVKGIEGLSQRLERELSGKFASGGELEAISGLVVDIINRMHENGLSDGLGR